MLWPKIQSCLVLTLEIEIQSCFKYQVFQSHLQIIMEIAGCLYNVVTSVVTFGF